jgi:transporter family-2 protein
MSILFLVMGVLAGVATGMQGGINAQLSARWAKNAVLASAISFTVGALTLWILVLVLRIPIPSLPEKLTWWHWCGGILGAYFVFSKVYLSQGRTSAGTVAAYLLAGQIVAAVIFDHFGLVGYPEIHISVPRILGIASLVGGVYLVNRY